jgi:hypothetical protein
MAIVEEAKRISGEPDKEVDGDVEHDVLERVREDGRDIESGVDIAGNKRGTARWTDDART